MDFQQFMVSLTGTNILNTFQVNSNGQKKSKKEKLGLIIGSIPSIFPIVLLRLVLSTTLTIMCAKKKNFLRRYFSQLFISSHQGFFCIISNYKSIFSTKSKYSKASPNTDFLDKNDHCVFKAIYCGLSYRVTKRIAHMRNFNPLFYKISVRQNLDLMLSCVCVKSLHLQAVYKEVLLQLCRPLFTVRFSRFINGKTSTHMNF